MTLEYTPSIDGTERCSITITARLKRGEVRDLVEHLKSNGEPYDDSAVCELVQFVAHCTLASGAGFKQWKNVLRHMPQKYQDIKNPFAVSSGPLSERMKTRAKLEPR